MEKKQSVGGFRRLMNATGYSWQGLKATWEHEAAFRQELGMLVLAVPLAAYLASSALEFVLLVGSVVLLMVVEILNSAIESVVDRFGGEQHPLSGRAKDQGSAAVMLTLGLVLAIWLAVAFG